MLWKSGYQSISQEDEIEANLPLSTSFEYSTGDVRKQEEEEYEERSFFEKHYRFPVGFLIIVSCILLITIGILSMNLHSMTPAASFGSHGPGKKGGDSKEDKHSVFDLTPCHKHCSDPCNTYSPSKGETLCCNWLEGEKGSHSCSLTVSDHGDCFCTAEYIDYSFIDGRKDKDKETKEEKKDAKKKGKTPTLAPAIKPSIPPWSQFVPDQWNPYHTAAPSAAAVAVSPGAPQTTVTTTESSAPWRNYIPDWNKWQPKPTDGTASSTSTEETSADTTKTSDAGK